MIPVKNTNSRTPFTPLMHEYLPRLIGRIQYPQDEKHRYVIIAHLFDDTMRMLCALDPLIEWDAIIGVPYSSDRPGVFDRWRNRFGDNVCIPSDLEALERQLVAILAKALEACRRNGQRLIVQDVGGFAAPILSTYFRDQSHLVKGVIEITKQGVWRAAKLDLDFPVLHCADSELKRLEAQRCGETVARCLDGVARDLGQSLAGRQATVFGGGWIGAGVARALARLDMTVAIVDRDPMKLVEARLNGFAADAHGSAIERSTLVVGATGQTSITPKILRRMPQDALVASASSRRSEIDMDWLGALDRERVSFCLDAYTLPRRSDDTGGDDTGGDASGGGAGRKRLLVVNNGYPANFIVGGGSVADEIVEPILGELIVLMRALVLHDHTPGVHRITAAQEAECASLWLDMRDATIARPA